jgi:predicted enzyme related to lactoylglutathione lyase
VELMTSDAEGARAFYRALLGWEFDIGGQETGYYTNCLLRGKRVAGLAGMQPGQEGPVAWTTYLATNDVKDTAQRTADNGGRALYGPLEVMGFGSMLVASDPTGAVFGAWQAGSHTGAELVNEPGTVVWNELATRDLDAAQRFYTAVFGCGWDDIDTGEGGPRYRTFSVDGRAVGGALEMTAEWPAEVEPHWMTYFEVADVDATVEDVQRLGGGVGSPLTDSAFGRFAVVSDPQGGHFTVMTSAPMAQE